MNNKTITFKSDLEEELILEKVHYNVNVNGLISNTAIEQHFSNPFEKNIEAVYTFPLTPSAVLMGIEIHINDRKLRGTIINAQEADTKYEEALDEGNRAIMVEKNHNGLYTVNVGNLLANDHINIIIEYSELLEWNQDRIKLNIPTVIAQKYGNPDNLNLDDTSTPDNKLLIENNFTFDMSVMGILQNVEFETPSHSMDLKKLENLTKLTLTNRSDLMDRDITIIMESKEKREERSFAIVGKDFDGYTAIASFYPSIDANYTIQVKNVTFVVDCSGSMSGVSIEKARSALSKAILRLNSNDTMNLILFGSYNETIFEKPVVATAENKDIINRAIDNISADMGGTEMAEALNIAYAQNSDIDTPSYLLLITDGEIYDHDRVIENAIKSEMRHFIVGVGYATDAVLLKHISQSTSGSFENVDPNEQMDETILNLFKKIDMPKTKSLNVVWPTETNYSNEPKYLFDGDTLYVMATFSKIPIGNITLNYTLENGDTYSSYSSCTEESVSNNEPSSIARIVANTKMLKMGDNKDIQEISKRYQIFSTQTKYILVDEVEDSKKPISIPETYKVDHMMSQLYCAPRSIVRPRLIVDSCDYSDDYLDIPAYMRSESSDNSKARKRTKNKTTTISAKELINSLPDYYIEQQASLLKNIFSTISVDTYPASIASLISLGIDRNEILEWLKIQNDEEQAVYDFIRELLNIYIVHNQNYNISAITSKHYRVGEFAN